jgi:hypothetical protein
LTKPVYDVPALAAQPVARLATCVSPIVVAGLLTTSCGDRSVGDPAPGPPSSPAFDAAWRISTHNSYWVDRGTPGDAFASGVQERFADQLLYDHARGVEIDVHPDPATPGAFQVFHTTPGDALCDTLPGCLAALRAFHHAIPRHEAVHVTIELKGISAPTFDAAHTIEDLDRIFEEELGALLYRPADLLARCAAITGHEAATLGDCARDGGWPLAHEVRGRFVLGVMGNWDGLGGQCTKDFVDYATKGRVADRAGFPMASSWQLDHESLSGPIYELVTQAELDAAYAEAVILQVEDTSDPAVGPFLARHGVIRIDGSVTAADQAARAALGMQLLQTDAPWEQDDQRGPGEPFRPLHRGFSGTAMKEPGSRLALGPSPDGAPLFAYAIEPGGAATAWETTVSSGADARRVGCLRAASAPGEAGDAITVCRTKVSALRDAMATSPAPSPDAERATVRVTVCRAGTCAESAFPSREPADEGPGDLIRIEVSSAGGGSCVAVRSAAFADRDATPRWEALGAPVCFGQALLYQGIATRGARPGWAGAGFFFGTRREGPEGEGEVGAGDFAGVVAIEPGAAPQDASALLADDSAP